MNFLTAPLAAFLGPYGWLAKWIVIAALAVACAAFGAAEMHKHDRKAYDALAAKYSGFVAQTKAEGEAAQKRADAQKAADEAAKGKADAESKRRLADLDARYKRLLDAGPGRDIVPAAPAGTGDPSRVCFDRTKLAGALSDFIGEAGGIAEAGDRAVIALDIAKAWAQRESRSP